MLGFPSWPSEVLGKLREALVREGLDAVVALSPENVTYTTGIVVPSHSLMRWRHAAAIVATSGEPGLMVVDMEADTVRERASPGRLVVYREFAEDPMDTLADLLTEMGLGDRMVRDAAEGSEKLQLPGGLHLPQACEETVRGDEVDSGNPPAQGFEVPCREVAGLQAHA